MLHKALGSDPSTKKQKQKTPLPIKTCPRTESLAQRVECLPSKPHKALSLNPSTEK
jgi:hypothetical protein